MSIISFNGIVLIKRLFVIIVVFPKAKITHPAGHK